MNLFDKLVSEALIKQPDLSSLRIVVEKELLHHDLLRILQENALMETLTFIGGTCLRTCYGGVRLSEDLDFTGGSDFSRTTLAAMGNTLAQGLQEKYGLHVSVNEPIEDKKNVDTWKVKIETRPQSKHLPAQCIHIDVCAIPSYEKRPMMLMNPYGVDMGTSGLIIQAQSREEIYTDKLVAFAFRPNRIKYRDLWDILWLHGQGFRPKLETLPPKLKDRSKTIAIFLGAYNERLQLLKEHPEMAAEFIQEMRRFLPSEQINKVLKQEHLWEFMIALMESLGQQVSRLRGTSAP